MVDEGGREISAVCLPRAGTPQAFYGLGSGIFPDVDYDIRKDQFLAVWTDIPTGLAGQRITDEQPIIQAGALLIFHMDREDEQGRCRVSGQVVGIYYTDQRQVLLDRAFMRVYKHRRAAGCEQFIPLDLDATIGDYL